MSHQKPDVLKTIAVNTVLKALGNPLFEILRYYLERDYNIVLYPGAKSPCSLLELHRAIGKIAGNSAADLMLEDIYLEMDRIAEMELQGASNVITTEGGERFNV